MIGHYLSNRNKKCYSSIFPNFFLQTNANTNYKLEKVGRGPLLLHAPQKREQKQQQLLQCSTRERERE